MTQGQLRTKHLREEIEETDGTRIYISRLWPRGVAKGERFSEWMQQLAPKRELLDAYLDDEIGWRTYEERFREQMGSGEAREAIDELAERVDAGERITLLCDHPSDAPADECHRFLLAQLVKDRLA